MSLSADTSQEIERLQIEHWRQMSAAQKGAVVSGLTQAVYDLARAGVRHRYPTKLRRFWAGGDVSDRQWRDVLGIIRVQGLAAL